MTMAYIIVVNPGIISETGMPFDGVMIATILSAAFASLLMGLIGNYPFALAPGMGLNAYFTYDALSKYKIYDNIKPFSTEELVNKLKPIKENDLESDVNYKVSISNIKLYSKLSTDSEESILALADESINTNTSNSTAPTLIQLDFKCVNSKWLVNNMIINRPLKNMPFLD
jgi:hypothetical protein